MYTLPSQSFKIRSKNNFKILQSNKSLSRLDKECQELIPNLFKLDYYKKFKNVSIPSFVLGCEKSLFQKPEGFLDASRPIDRIEQQAKALMKDYFKLKSTQPFITPNEGQELIHSCLTTFKELGVSLDKLVLQSIKNTLDQSWESWGQYVSLIPSSYEHDQKPLFNLPKITLKKLVLGLPFLGMVQAREILTQYTLSNVNDKRRLLS